MLLALLLVLLQGCESLGIRASHPDVPYCLAAQPVVTDERDVLTDDTAKQIEDGICTGVHLCGWDAKGLDCEH